MHAAQLQGPEFDISDGARDASRSGVRMLAGHSRPNLPKRFFPVARLECALWFHIAACSIAAEWRIESKQSFAVCMQLCQPLPCRARNVSPIVTGSIGARVKSSSSATWKGAGL
jgi:hypothetical protein